MRRSEWEFGSLSTLDDSNHGFPIPEWVSLEPIEFQIIWQKTAGKRPEQPKKERRYYEKLWEKNSVILKNLKDDHKKKEEGDIKKGLQTDYSLMAFRSFEHSGPYGIQITHIKISWFL